MIKVFCNECKAHIYNMEKEPLIDQEVCASMFTPSDDSIPQPQIGDNIICPKCGKAWTIRIGPWGHKLLTDQGVLPK